LKILLTILLAIASFSAVAQKPGQFAYSIPIEGTGGDAFYRIAIPQPVYEATAFPDLRDLRVFNGSGEPVPYAFRAIALVSQKPEPVTLPFFPLRGPRDARAEDLDVNVSRAGGKVNVTLHVRGDSGAQKVLLGFLVDASALKAPLSGLLIGWGPAGVAHLTSARVEASDDLRRWTTLVGDAPLGGLSHAGQHLERNTIEFRSHEAKYLRLTWLDTGKAIEVDAVRGLVPEQWQPPERMWKEVTAKPDAATPGDYQFDLEGRFPIDRLEFALPQENTVVPLQVFTRNDPKAKWMAVAGTVAYRLKQDGRDLASPALVLGPNTHRYWLLRVDMKAGGIGSGALGVKAGWTPRELIFNARGGGPFRLSYGNAKAESGALPLETMVPDLRPDRAPKIALVGAGAPNKVAGSAAMSPGIDAKAWGLWAALAAGVAVLAWMAWTLSRQMQKADKK